MTATAPADTKDKTDDANLFDDTKEDAKEEK